MAESKQFNSLGQILAHGGEISLGLAISRGETAGQVFQTIATRWPDLSPQDRAELYGIANQGAAAGAYLNTLGPGEMPDLDLIPVNASLFGESSGGKRILFVADVTNPSTGETIGVREGFAVNDTLEAMIQYLSMLIQQWQDTSPTLGERFRAERETLLDFYWNFAERKF